MLSDDRSTLSNTFQGSATNGNTITRRSRFQNISGTPFVITGVADVRSLDPEDLGIPDITPSNASAGTSAMKALFPSYDLFLSTSWTISDPPRRLWETEVTFFGSFPILVKPDEEFEYSRVSRNDLLGPNFGPLTGISLSAAQVNAIGEVVIAIDLDWHFVPEPASAWLMCAGLLGLRRLRALRRSAGQPTA